MILSNTIPQTTIWAALEARIATSDSDPVLSSGDHDWTAADLRDAAEKLAGRLAARGIRQQSRVMTMLPNSIDHATLLLALSRLGAVWAAVAADTRGPVLVHIVATVQPELIIATPAAAKNATTTDIPDQSIVAFDPVDGALADSISETAIVAPDHLPDLDDIRSLVFTSGTTGPPKGVLVTERMLVASAWGAAHASDAAAGDRFLLWEPLYHIGGSQMLVLSLLLPIRLVVVPKFSAARFWADVRSAGVTKLHYLGGILEILLAQPPDAKDTNHDVRLAFGAGARRDVWHAFQDRFQIPLREVYGLTEASSFTTINRDGLVGSIGKCAPWMNVALADENGASVPAGQVGEIVIRSRVPGLLTPGYLGDRNATTALLKGGALHTGDLARADGHGGYSFVGRKKDAIRCRGEMVSAWEVETTLLAHPDIAECAVVAVPAAVGEEDILVFICPAQGILAAPEALADWAAEIMPRRSRPRYWRIVDDFPRTPSARIAKSQLSRDVASAYDASRQSNQGNSLTNRLED